MKQKLPRLDKSAISVGPLRNDGEEVRYWLSVDPLERLRAVETNRRMVYGERRVTSRLQRFLEVVERSPSRMNKIRKERTK